MGSDTLLGVSGGKFCLWTADADVVAEITTRRNDFPKPTEVYFSLDIYGKNILTTEGAAWRRHRKLLSPPFTERNNHLVWTETLDQTQAMLDSWLGKNRKGHGTVERIMDDTMRLSLHIISRACFGRKLEWPTNEKLLGDKPEVSADQSKIRNEAAEAAEGHTMSFTYALHCLLDNIIWTFLVSHWILKRSPLPPMRRAWAAYAEWGSYMREMMNTKKAAIWSGKGMDEMDIMGQLVKCQALASDEKSVSKEAPLSDSEILGNAYLILLAGHETTANSLHFAILLLALNVSAQRHLQKDLDDHFRGRPASQWDYNRDLPALFGGMAGAVMNEQLRLISPVVHIPKSANGVGDQPLNVNGKKCTLPADSYINLCTISVQSNPKFWPHGPPRHPQKPVEPFGTLDNDLGEFKPERWLLDGNSRARGFTSGETKGADHEDLGLNAGADTADSLYRPPKGAFIPFSEGYRACLGRRFAQVEVMAALAVIFSQYSAELAVDKYASDEEIDRMDQQERAQVWEKAAADAGRLIRSSSTILTLQMRRGHVPIRFVKRGHERFNVDT